MTENKHSDNHNYPKIIPLISLNGKRQCVKLPRVLYCHVSNRLTNPEYFYHQMIIISISQWKRTFKWVSTTSWVTFNDLLVLEIIIQNWRLIEPFGNFVGSALERLKENLELNINLLDEQENTEHWYIKVSQHGTGLFQNWYCVTSSH